MASYLVREEDNVSQYTLEEGGGSLLPEVEPPPSPTPGTFVLDFSTLGGVQHATKAFDMAGEFRDIQFHWSQSVTHEDMEPHFLELHFTLSGVEEGL